MNTLTLAKQFRKAITEEGITQEAIHAAAVELSKKRDPQYMPDATKWMAEKGYQVNANR